MRPKPFVCKILLNMTSSGQETLDWLAQETIVKTTH